MNAGASILFALALLLASCAPAVAKAPAATRPAPIVASAAPETSDDELRYRPPPLAPPTPAPAPVPVEIALANGARALVLERHDAPLVSVEIAFHAPRISPLGTTDVVAQALLARGPLGDVLAGGVVVTTFVDRLTVGFTTHTADLEPTLRAVLEALAAGPRDAAALEQERARLLAVAAARKPSAAWPAWSSWRFPAGHPYHSAVPQMAEATQRMSLADVQRYVADLVRPETATFCVVGDVSAPALGAVLERAAGSLKGAGRAPRRPDRVPQPRGALVTVQAAEVGRAPLRFMLPLPRYDAANVAAEAAVAIAAGAFLAGRQTGDPRPIADGTSDWTHVRVEADHGRLSRTMFVDAGVRADQVGAAVARVLAEMARVARGEITDDEMRRALVTLRDPVFRIDREGAPQAARDLAFLAYHGATPATVIARRAAFDRLRRDEIEAAAASWLRKEALQIWVQGDDATEKQLSALGIAPIVVQKVKR